ncbi:hypothetical protein KC361_g9271 [Hortaea werneckii]|nr:hypothetical protein KC361_g9271 [Hortaea werneckii]
MLTGNSERKKSHDKLYPKGYVELLEQQQNQLVSGLQEMYHRLQKASAWHGKPLDVSSGRPLTHDILAALKLLESKNDGSCELEAFEENCDKPQSRLVSKEAEFAHRRGAISSDSELSHHDQSRTVSSYNAPVYSTPSMLTEYLNYTSATSSRPTHSTLSGSRQPPQPPQHHHPVPLPIKPSPLQMATAKTDPQLYTPEWAQTLADISAPGQSYRTECEIEALEYRCLLGSPWDRSLPQYDWSTFKSHFPAYQEQVDYVKGNGSAFGGGANSLCPLSILDVDFSSKFVQPQIL